MTATPADALPVPAPPESPDVAFLEAVGLVRIFGAQRALDGIDFRLAPGETMALLGPNGAGKSTLLRILAGGLRASEGEVRLGGTRLDLHSAAWLRRVGVLSHQTFLYGHLTARENLRFYAELYDLDLVEERVRAGLEGVGLTGRGDDPVRTFSRGMRQRLALARTLIHEPDVVLLDEPYTGLDAHAAAVLREVLGSLRDGRRTVILVTHNLTEGLEMADRVAIQVRGRFVVDAPAASFDPASFHGVYRDAVERAASGA